MPTCYPGGTNNHVGCIRCRPMLLPGRLRLAPPRPCRLARDLAALLGRDAFPAGLATDLAALPTPVAEQVGEAGKGSIKLRPRWPLLLPLHEGSLGRGLVVWAPGHY